MTSRKQRAASIFAVIVFLTVVFCISSLVRYLPAKRRLRLSEASVASLVLPSVAPPVAQTPSVASSVAEADVEDRWEPEVTSQPPVYEPSSGVNDSVVAEIVRFIFCLLLTRAYFDRPGTLDR